MNTAAELVERLYLPENKLVAQGGQTYRLKEVIFFTTKDTAFVAQLEGGRTVKVVTNLSDIEKMAAKLFIRVSRYYLVALDRIERVVERYPENESEPDTAPLTTRDAFDECELILDGTDIRPPVTSIYARELKKALSVGSLHHLVPEHPDDKRMRLLELIDFGWRELFNLDPADNAAVEAFKTKWDIRQFTRERMLSYFRQVNSKQINKRRVIKNIVWQMFRWIKKGIEPLSDGNIRSLWYKIKAVLSYHSNILEPGDVDIFYNVLSEMIEADGLFRYKDFGFMDVNEPYRGIGGARPEVVLASEKIGHFFFIRKLAAEAGASFICLKGEPAMISLEYFSDDLGKAVGEKEITIFCVSDVDPAGYSIERNLVHGLTRQGLKVPRVVKLVDPLSFTSEEISIVRYPVVSFKEQNGEIKPVLPADRAQVTKARDWFSKEIKDDRLWSEKESGGGKTVTIWGIESDAADRDSIKKRFLNGLATETGPGGSEIFHS